MRYLAAIVTVTLLAASCGGRQEVYEVAPEEVGRRGATLPEPIPATPVFVASSERPLSKPVLKRLAAAPGVAVLAPVQAARLRVRGPGGSARLTVGAVEPLKFRSVAPPSTREAEFIWISLVVGHAVPTFDAAKELGLEGSGSIEIAGTPGFQVGALADNGTPNIVDVLVQNGVERQLPLEEATLAVVGAESGVTIQRLARDLRKAAPGIKLERLVLTDTAPAPSQGGEAPRPIGYVSGGVVGSMRFEILKNGFIRPDPSWVAANIVSASVPIIGTVRCHRLLVPRLQAAMQAVQDQGLAGQIRRGDYGGCYVPRFIDRDPTSQLSLHAFGLAVDFNVSTNQLGTRGDMDPRIVAIFERLGFTWGGRWARPDPMHFELSS